MNIFAKIFSGTEKAAEQVVALESEGAKIEKQLAERGEFIGGIDRELAKLEYDIATGVDGASAKRDNLLVRRQSAEDDMATGKRIREGIEEQLVEARARAKDEAQAAAEAARAARAIADKKLLPGVYRDIRKALDIIDSAKSKLECMTGGGNFPRLLLELPDLERHEQEVRRWLGYYATPGSVDPMTADIRAAQQKERDEQAAIHERRAKEKADWDRRNSREGRAEEAKRLRAQGYEVYGYD